MKDDVALIIPAYNPDNALSNIVHELLDLGFKYIVVIDDGSDRDRKFCPFYGKAYIITHNINCGKGIAIKSGLELCLQKFPNIFGVITVDADGQHSTKDIERIYNEFKRNKDSVILGTRDFNEKNVPFIRKFGNIKINKIFEKKTGISLKDTQTGLRAIPKKYINDLIDVEGNRYEYEMNMLLYFVKHNIQIREIPIEVIYKNKHSHFKMFNDSIQIYKAISKENNQNKIKN